MLRIKVEREYIPSEHYSCMVDRIAGDNIQDRLYVKRVPYDEAGLKVTLKDMTKKSWRDIHGSGVIDLTNLTEREQEITRQLLQRFPHLDYHDNERK